MSTSSIAPVANTPGCWESFTSGASSAMQSVAAAAASLFAKIKSGLANMFASIAPAFNNMIGWMKANPQAAIVAGGVAAVASLGALYYCFCTKDAEKPANKDAKAETDNKKAGDAAEGDKKTPKKSAKAEN